MEQSPLHNPFDKQIGDALSRLSPALPPDGWLQFLQKLEAAEDPEAAFDRHIAASLNGLAPEPDHWHLFEARLNATLPTDELVDLTIKDKVGRLYPAYKEQHWQLLKQQMHRQRTASVARLWRAAAGLAAAVVLAITFTHLWNIYSRQSSEELVLTALFGKSGYAETGSLTQAQAYPKTQSTWAENVPDRPILSPRPTEPRFISGAMSDTVSIALQAGSMDSAPDLTLAQSAMPTGNADIARVLHPVPDRLPLLPVHILSDTEWSGASTSVLSPVSLSRSRRSRLALYYSPQVDIVMPPSQDAERLYDVYRGNLGVGLAFSHYVDNNWCVETGMAYDNKNYRQPVVQKIGIPEPDKYDLNLKTIVFRMVRVPVQVSRRLADSKRVGIYATAGVQGHFVLQSSFNRIYTKDPIVVPEPPDQYNPTPYERPVFMQGLLEGGALNENAYMSVIAGLGVEWHLGAHTDLFVQPTYSHALPIGRMHQTQDRFHTPALSIGLRQNL